MKPTRTQAEYIGNVNEIQRLRAELVAVRAELSNARVARDKALCECAELRAQLDADEIGLAEELDRLRLKDKDCPKCPMSREKGIVRVCGRPRAWSD